MKIIILLCLLFTVGLKAQTPPIVWNGDYAKLLKEQLNFKDAAYILTGTADPTSVATTAPKGSIYMRQGTSGEVYYKTDDGSSTNWELISNLSGPVSSTDNALVKFDGTSGLVFQNTGAILDDSNNLSGIANLTVTGTTTLDTALTGVVKAASGVISASDVDLTSEVTGVLPIANGGTNSSTALNNDRVIVSTAGAIVESATTTTQLGYLDATSSIQTQLDAKLDDVVTANDNEIPRFDTNGQALQNSGVTIDDSDNVTGVVGFTVTGDITTAETASRALQTDGAGAIEASAVTTTELGYVSGVTSAIQTQLDAKLDDVGTANDNEIVRFDADGTALQNTSITIDDTDNVAGVSSLNLSDQASAPSNPTANDATLFVQDDYLYQQNSVGDSKRIYPAELNYIDDSDAELNIDNWATYADAAASTPADGTGGDATVALNRTTTAAEVLRGNASFELVKDGSDRQGEGVSYDFSIDPADENKVHYLGFDVKTSANYASGDVVVYIYDVTNTTLITPTNTEILAATSDGARFEANWTATDSNSYRLILHVATTNASAYDVYFDDVDINARKIGSVPRGAEALVSVYLGTKQSNQSSVTQILFDTEDYDKYDNFASNEFTAPFDGKYLINASAYLSPTTTNELNYGSVLVNKNGSEIFRQQTPIIAEASGAAEEFNAVQPIASKVLQLAKGDVLTFDVFGSSVNYDIASGENLTYLTIDLVEADSSSVNIYQEDNLTKWQEFTPTFNNDTGHSATVLARKRRNGPDLEIIVRYIPGGDGTDSGSFTMDLPDNLNHDLSTTDSSPVGYFGMVREGGGTDEFYVGEVRGAGTTRTINFIGVTPGASGNSIDILNGDDIGVSSGYHRGITFKIGIPIQEWADQNTGSLVGFAGATAEQGGLVTTANQSLGSGEKYFESNVGIGITSPARTLHIDSGTADRSYIHFSNDNSTDKTSSNGALVGLLDDGANATFIVGPVESDGELSLLAGGNTAIRVDSTGNVGIGTSSPAASLEVSGPTGIIVANDEDETTDGSTVIEHSGDVSAFSNANSDLTSKTIFLRYLGSSSRTDMRHNGSGVGSANACFSSSSSGLRIFGICSSSRRYKTDIKSVTDIESRRIYDLKPVSFVSTQGDPDVTHYGLIAEDVSQVIPEVVTYNKDKGGREENVRYKELVPLLIKELKKLKQRIEDLEQQ